MDKKYRKMLKVMEGKEKFSPDPGGGENWFLYILRCHDGSFYTGIAKDLKRRLTMHEKGKAARYTRSRRPVALCYTEELSGRTEALVRECRVKALTRQQKEELVAGSNL